MIVQIRIHVNEGIRRQANNVDERDQVAELELKNVMS